MNLFSIKIIGFNFNPQYFDFISIILTTHGSICNNSILIFFQFLILQFYFNHIDYTWIHHLSEDSLSMSLLEINI